ncbi:FAD-dependent monooxygenase [Croceimicrobium hydrocarbonivorans]|uniref:FAD-dependent monooxygenase n=1 Tax=Croceimicrobium hydrocarbonivorans TaxID=2761580 RepID=A0A7H0VFV1_9FLAO|nr:FAD-dependent monooxygenase [Croceimicrobium hydrocarbonivorans]QNR24599.1 FAD-dependent monooxygenase [Croceimicrobium hydrocarbonivorans]
MEIAIIGGGISGLSMSLALAKLGIQSTVYERAEDLSEVGAGLWLQPNALRVLQRLGIEDEILKAGFVLNKMEIAYPNLKAVKEVDSNVVADRFGNQTVAIHRARLQAILLEKVKAVAKVELGMPYLSHKQQGDQIEIQFENAKRKADWIIGADGIKSKLRQSLGFASEYRQSHQICARGIAHIRLPEALRKEGKELWGPKRRFGFSHISEDQVYFFAVLNTEISPAEISIDSLQEMYADFDPVVNQIIRATDFVHSTELADLKRLDSWHKDRACLIGDAAHATTPNMGQGACQGIEDAYYLAQLIHKRSPNLRAAFQEFEAQRRAKVDYVVNNSWRFGQLVHKPWGQFLLKSIMKITPENVVKGQMEKLYAVD